MNKMILTIAFVFTALNFCLAQKIEIEKTHGRYNFIQNDENLSLSVLAHKLKPNDEAHKLIRKARTRSAFSSLFAFAGGGVIGWSIATGVRDDDDIDWAIAGAGAGLIVIAIPISYGANRKAKEAVEKYNSSLNSTSYNNFKPEFEIIANGNGIGLSMRF